MAVLHIFLIFPIFFRSSFSLFEPESHPNWHLLPPKDKCGVSIQKRFTQGNKIALGSIPWIARIGYEIRNPMFPSLISYNCGGSLISKYFVLTAAHCVILDPNEEINHIRFGESFAVDDPDCVPNGENSVSCAPPVQDIGIVHILVHPNYANIIAGDDIALIKIENPPQLSAFVQPICLPYGVAMNYTFEYEQTTVAGWGVTEKGEISMDLLAVVQQVTGEKICQESYEREFYGIIDNEKMICVGGVYGKDSCNGDSGGPLAWFGSLENYISERTYLIGIISFGPSDCGVKGVPGIYTRVTTYMEWILNNINQ